MLSRLRKGAGDATKVINLVKSIEKTAEDASDDPWLIAMAENASARCRSGSRLASRRPPMHWKSY